MQRWRGGARLIVAIAAVMFASRAQAQSEETPAPANAEQQLLRWLTAQDDEWGRHCSVNSFVRAGTAYHVACGQAGLWTVAPRDGVYAVTHQQDFGRAAQAFVMDPEGYVFLRLAGASPEEPDSLAPIPGMRVGPPALDERGAPLQATLEQIEVRGTVVETRGLDAVIDRGTRHGLRVDNHVRFVTGRGHQVGVVTQADAESSRVSFGLNEPIRAGDGAVLSREPTTASTIGPSLSWARWHLGANLRPVFHASSGQVGAILDAWVGVRALRDLTLDLRLAPAVLATSNRKPVGGFRAYAMFTSEFRWFSAGLGLGLENHRTDNARSALPTVATRLVFGAQDGLHLQVFMSSVFRDGSYLLSSFAPSIQVPVARSASLLLAMYAGAEGAMVLETGVRALISGGGNSDSLFLRFAVGMATVWGNAGGDLGGSPQLSLGMEYRL